MTMPDHSVPWYRTKVPPDVHTAVHRTSDIKAWGQTLAFMGMLMAWFSLALYCHYRADRQLLAGFFTVLYGAHHRVIPAAAAQQLVCNCAPW
jgi:hypothetical protein